MNFLPVENITYTTRLNEEEILLKLGSSIMPQKVFRINSLSSNLKPYEGTFDSHTFNIRRVIKYRNSFLPRIIGNIDYGFNRNTINVKMRLRTFVIIFLCVWCSIAAAICLLSFNQIRQKTEFDIFSLMPFGMLIFVYVLTMAAFNYESAIAKKNLLNIFEAEYKE